MSNESLLRDAPLRPLPVALAHQLSKGDGKRGPMLARLYAALPPADQAACAAELRSLREVRP